MTIEDADTLLRQVKYWHYPFDLPWGTTVPSRPGVDPERHLKRKKHFFDRLVSRYAGSLEGKTVLDLGIDSSEAFVSEAQAIALLLGMDNCEFRCRLLETAPWWEEQSRSEITLMLGVFYHLVDPIFVLRKAASLTSETLVVDTAILPGEGALLGLLPRNPEEPTTCGSNLVSRLRVFPTKEALVSLIADAGFDQIECLDPNPAMPPEYLNGHRVSVIARRR
jgi:hypothetical protein